MQFLFQSILPVYEEKIDLRSDTLKMLCHNLYKSTSCLFRENQIHIYVTLLHFIELNN